MKKSLLKIHLKIYLVLTLVYLALTIVSLLAFYFLAPKQYFMIYPAINIFFWILGIALNYYMNHVRVGHPDRLLNSYMMCRVIKFFLTLILLVIGVLIARWDRASFSIALICNYFIYSILDVYTFHLYNKRITGNGHKK